MDADEDAGAPSETSTGPSPDGSPAALSAAATGPARFAVYAILVIAFGLAAIVGAYLDWQWWPVYSGLTLTLVAVPLSLFGAILAIVTNGRLRRIALVILAIGAGLLAGQNLGPVRAPLLHSDGSMTITLDGPIEATASGPATCSTVADGSELSIGGDPNLRLDTTESPFVSVYFDIGDRWEALNGGPRANGVRLVITVTPRAVPADGRPAMIGMGADATSSVTIDANATGGVVRFDDLVPLADADYTGEAMDLSGMIEFICDEPAQS